MKVAALFKSIFFSESGLFKLILFVQVGIPPRQTVRLDAFQPGG
jgi:hypothetical protein